MSQKLVAIKMDRERHLKYGMNQLVALENALGTSISAIGDTDFKMADLLTLYRIGLQWEDRSLTDEKVGDLLDIVIEEQGMQYLAEKLAEAFKTSVGSATYLPSK